MAYFDLVDMKVPGPKLQRLLGYKRIFSTEEMPITATPNSPAEKCIVKSAEQGVLRSALRKSNVMGIMIADNELLRIVIEDSKESSKPIFISSRDFVCAETSKGLRNLHRAKTMLRFAMRSRARVALVSMADDASCLLSSMQMLELARFLSGSDEYAKKMLAGWYQ